MYDGFIKKYPVVSIEDAFDQDDWDAWSKMCDGLKIQLVGWGHSDGSQITTNFWLKCELLTNFESCFETSRCFGFSTRSLGHVNNMNIGSNNTFSNNLLLLWHAPYLGSTDQVFNLHVLRSCASSVFTPFSSVFFLITSLHLSLCLPIFRCPHTFIF